MSRKIISYFLFLVLAALLLYFSFRGVQWGDFKEGLNTARYDWIFVSMAFGVLAFWLRGARWRLLIRGAGYRVTNTQAFNAVTIGYLTNFGLPRAGELARCGALAGTGAPFDALLGTVVLERAFDTLCLLAITALVIGLQWSVFGFFMTHHVWNPFMGLLVGKTFYFIAILLFLTLLAVFAFIYRKRLLSLFVFKKIYALAVGVIHGFKSGYKMQQRWPFFGYTLGLWICYLAMSFCTIQAFSAVSALNLLDAAFLMVVGSLGWVLPVQGGIGAYHFIVSLALTSVYGVSQTEGLIFATVSHGSQALTMIVFGLISLFSSCQFYQIGKNRKEVI